MNYKVQIDEVVRNATADEIATIKAIHAEQEAHAVAVDQLAAVRVSALTKLKALGLTDDEIAALVG